MKKILAMFIIMALNILLYEDSILDVNISNVIISIAILAISTKVTTAITIPILYHA